MIAVNAVTKSVLHIYVEIRIVSVIRYGKTALTRRNDRPRGVLYCLILARRLSGKRQAHELGFCQASHFCQA